MRLNKYLAHCGLGTRRQADALILKGKVEVNGEVMKNPAYTVQDTDEVLCSGKKLYIQKGKAYILMNKPKLFDCHYDLENHKSVAKLVKNKYSSEVTTLLPLPLIDRGLILLTDDESVIEKFDAEDHQLKQIFQLTLDKPITKADLTKLTTGIALDDGTTYTAASADYVEEEPEHVIGVTTHSTITDHLRLMLSAIGYEVLIADRTYIGGLTKKNLPRGFFRDLTEKEIVFLRHFL